MAEYKVFDEVTGHVSLGKHDSSNKSDLYEMCKEVGAKCTDTPSGVAITGTLRQLYHIEIKVGRKLINSAVTSSMHGSPQTPSYETTIKSEPYVAIFMQKICYKQLQEMEKKYGIRITWSNDGNYVKLTSKSPHRNHFQDGCADFTSMYSYFYKEVTVFTMDVSITNAAYSRSDLEKALHQLPEVIDGVVLMPMTDGRTYKLYGTPATLTAARNWIQKQLRIDPSGLATASSSKSQNEQSHETPNKIKVVVCCGDITKENVDAIVNACNEDLYHSGGVSWAISKAGGPLIQQESTAYVGKFGRVATGDVAVTGSGNLNCKAIMHAVGPQWGVHGKKGSISALKQICSKVFSISNSYGFKSVAMPAISSGIYGVPRDVCAQAIFASIDKLDEQATLPTAKPFEIRLVNIDVETSKVFSVEFHKWKLKGRKLERRNSFHSVKGSRVKEKPGVRQTGADDMNYPPKIRAPLVPTMELPKKSNSKPVKEGSTMNASSAATTVTATLLSVAKTAKKSSRTSSSQLPSATNKQSKRGSDTKLAPSFTNAEGSISTSIKDVTPQRDAKPTQEVGTSNYDATSTSASGQTDKGLTKDECPICKCTITSPKLLSKCGHKFCTTCIDTAFSYQKKCPICQEIYGVSEGTQPQGTMTVNQIQGSSLPGYEGVGYFYITYNIPSGTQDARHPNPGQQYHGTRRQAFIPDTKEGKEVVELLRKAFDKKLIFTVGRSSTTGAENCVTWNDIHHKTSMSGGPQRFGYPDPDYLRRVKEELKAKGIVPESRK